ncbi:DinB family protein [Hymenobacter chitinivorans]|uniref:Putative damage-inducible protein DinB n=1 Tax=Hymenobacter chitinivorans DSM 11115 TaxID=1121954 RepID=A0A2M9BNF7_9BACT|nr:DinB family protein [Hymenobacter chitinivorans]PJJ59477.1 putative damage-inducible protein DinB [Hymenobacter chitinivorans DSM 11115]
MEIHTVASFLDYHERIRQRTDKLVALVPADQLEWRCRPGSFSIGDTIRHIVAIERYLYAEVAAGRPSTYRGCGRDLADGPAAVLDFYWRLRAESTGIFRALTDQDLPRKCLTPGQGPIALWKWLRALVEHEIHHRGQLYLLLAMTGVPTPPIFGLTSEEVISLGTPRSTGSDAAHPL